MIQLKALDFLKYEEFTLKRKWDSGDMNYVDAERHKKIKESIAELEALQEPKTCHSCVFNEDKFCMHCDVPDGDTVEYIKFSGCGLHQPIPQQPESKDDNPI